MYGKRRPVSSTSPVLSAIFRPRRAVTQKRAGGTAARSLDQPDFTNGSR
jgi:hypothetical protein